MLVSRSVPGGEGVVVPLEARLVQMVSGGLTGLDRPVLGAGLGHILTTLLVTV